MSDSPLLTSEGMPVYARIPRELLRDVSVSRDARLLWVVLDDFTSKESTSPWPSQAKLAEYMGATDRAVRNWLNELVRAGWLEVVTRPGTSNIHRMKWRGDASGPRNDSSGVGRNDSSGGSGTTVPPKQHQEASPDEATPPNPPDGGGGEEPARSLFGDDSPPANADDRKPKRRSDRPCPRFDAWWEQWPNKVDRKPARRAWSSLLASGVGADRLDLALLNYLAAIQTHKEATGLGPQIMHGATFLRGRWERYETDPSPDPAWPRPARPQGHETTEAERVLAQALGRKEVLQ